MLKEGQHVRTIGRPRPLTSKRKPFHTRVDLRDVMADYHKASENRWDIANHPEVVRRVAKGFYNRLKKVSQFKGHSTLDRLKRVSGVDQMEACLDDIWQYAEERRVLLIA